MTSATSDNYFLEIESHFAFKRQTPFILSAKDWVLMKKWHDEGVPLPVVIEAIDSVFEKNETSGRRKVINSLSYCRHAVKEIWQDRKDLQVGEGDVPPEQQPDVVLRALATEIESSTAPKEVVEFVAAELRGLRVQSVPAIEEKLMEIERQMIERIVSAGPADEIRAEVARAIGAATLDEKTRARTEEANLRRIVRARFGLPRLTLFR